MDRIGSPHADRPDPVAAMPALRGLGGLMARIQSTRIIGAGGWTAVGMRLRRTLGADHADACDLFEIFLSAGAARQIVIAVLDEDDAVAHWRGVGRAANLDLILETEAGDIVQPYPRLGSVALGAVHMRRKHAFLKRRPRFLVRRKAGARGLEQVTIIGRDLSPGAMRQD
jgi:hypothetical protein